MTLLCTGRSTVRLLSRTATPRVYGVRHFTNPQQYDALVLNAYTDSQGITLPATHGISTATRTALLESLSASQFKKKGDVRLLYNVGGVKQVAVVGLGKPKTDLAQTQEDVRMATALGLQAVQKQGALHVGVDVSVNSHAAAEGAVLSQFSFEKLKTEASRRKEIRFGPFSQAPALDQTWESGEIYGASQNLARMLMVSPGNLMTPKLFSDEIAYLLAGLDKTDVIVHDETWATKNNMNAFTCVAKGSHEPLRFLEVHYKGGKETDPVHALVGKGVTFDSGGISLKPCNNMDLMKGDLGGASTVMSAMHGIIRLGLPVNIVAVAPLCENMPSGNATKPGDVVKAMSGKSIEVLNTDAEGRLILADALYYVSSKYKLASILDVATLTGAIDVALGQVYAGVFTNSDDLWGKLNKAGQAVSDPFWRMPLHDGYLEGMKPSPVADINNLGKGRSGSSSSAAMFLKEFVVGLESNLDEEKDKEAKDPVAWAHLDIAGVMDVDSTRGYNIKGMTGRPTRALIEYFRNLSKQT
ncbi:hypothetical protein BDF14DRAFT_1854591 [Spinellus fusiger]|nr:hypothetical protein BDF14DRAFT_1854591 [Spinellus fusiger]